MELASEFISKKLSEKIDESNPQLRKKLSKQIDKLFSDSLIYFDKMQDKYNDYFDRQQKYVILYYLNSISIAHDIALLQQQEYPQNSSVMIASRSIFEGCSTCLQLIREYNQETYSDFFKYLVVNDLFQDLTIYNGWDELNLDYLNRFHNIISEYFSDFLEKTSISKYDGRISDYSQIQIDDIKLIIKKLYNDYKYKYKKSNLCKELFSNNNLIKSEQKVDSSVIYPINCHFSHLNLSGIDDMCNVTIDNKNYISLNNNHHQLLITIQWVLYSLEYIFNEIKEFLDNDNPTDTIISSM